MLHQRRQKKGAFILGAIFLACLGCQSAQEPLFPVQGQVKHEGKLLTTGTVVLHPDATKDNASQHEPRGVIDAEGRFTIRTHPREGAPPGWYKISVIAMEQTQDADNPYAIPKSLIPEKFGKPDESGLFFEVRKDAPPGAYDLDLK
jgi:hypothetical protein